MANEFGKIVGNVLAPGLLPVGSPPPARDFQVTPMPGEKPQPMPLPRGMTAEYTQQDLNRLNDLKAIAEREGSAGGKTIDQINAELRDVTNFFAGKKADAAGEEDEGKDTSVADKVTELEGLLKPFQTDTGGIREDLLGGEDLPSTFDLSAAITAAKGAGSLDDDSITKLQTVADVLKKRNQTREVGFMGTFDDPRDADRFLSATGSRSSYVDPFGQVTPTGQLETLAKAPDLPEGTQLQLSRYQAQPDEFLNADKYTVTPTKYNVDAAQAEVSTALQQPKSEAESFQAATVADQVAKTQIQAARQQGLTDYVEAAKGEVDVKSTVQGQLAALMQQFEGGQVPAFAAGAIRTAEQRLAARGLGASSMAGRAIMQAAMEATLPIAAADAETYRRMSEANLNNRQQAEVLNAQMTLQMDMQNLSNEQQARVANTQNQIQSLFTDQAAVNSSRQFNAQSEQQNDQFFANLFNQTAQFNSAQTNAIRQFNAGQANTVSRFNSELANQRDQFNTKNRLLIDQANAVYRRQINTANTAIQNAENEFNTRNLFNISQTAQANLLQQHRDELNFARLNTLNELDYNRTLAISSFAYDRDLELAQDIAVGSAGMTVLGGLLGALEKPIAKALGG